MPKENRYLIFPQSIPAIIIVLLLLAGCAPVISKQIRERVNPDIMPEEVLRNPEQYKGEMIILSGEIIEIENKEDNTSVKVLQLPAGFRGKPKDMTESEGRFLAIVDHYLDPFIYTKGRKVTVAGKVEGTRQLPLGETQYNYPVIHVAELYLWPIERDYYYPYPSFHIGFGFGHFF